MKRTVTALLIILGTTFFLSFTLLSAQTTSNPEPSTDTIQLPVTDSLTLLIAALEAADTVRLRIRMGGFAGLNLAGAAVNPDIPLDPRYGIMVGSIFELEFMDPVYMQLEPQFVQKGGISRYTATNVAIEERYKFDYLAFPLNLKVRFNISDFHAHVLGGANIGFLLSGEQEFDFAEQSPSIDVSRGLEVYDVAIDIAGGVEFPVSPTFSWFGELRYSHGMSNTLVLFGLDDDRFWKSRDIKITFGALFEMQKAVPFVPDEP